MKELEPAPVTSDSIRNSSLVPIYKWFPILSTNLETDILQGELSLLPWDSLYDLGGLHLYVATLTVTLLNYLT